MDKRHELEPTQGEEFMAARDRVVTFEGIGAIEPTNDYTVTEVVVASDEAQKPVEDPFVVCVDERGSAEAKQPVREKVAGGLLSTAADAAAAVDWSGFTMSDITNGPERMLEVVADKLETAGEKLAAHEHTPKHGNGTGCGKEDRDNEIHFQIGQHASDDIWLEQAKVDLGDNFDMEHWSTAQVGYRRLASYEKWKNDRPGLAQKIVKQRGGLIEVLDATQDVSRDPDNKRKGHWAEGARVNPNQGYSNDRDNARIPAFQVDVAPIIRACTAMANNGQEFSKLLHAMVMLQYGTLFVLTDNMRIIR